VSILRSLHEHFADRAVLATRCTDSALAACADAFGDAATIDTRARTIVLGPLPTPQGTVAVVAAGMDGALPSVLAGLTGAPIVAVPTSVGYGASFGGLAALLGMLNSCAPGVSVVNIDNG
jgi:pyridinium-3,5-biscarboxylic acid mononucleotide synthase